MSEWAHHPDQRIQAACLRPASRIYFGIWHREGPGLRRWFLRTALRKSYRFLNSSPFLHLKNAKTPTLILQGEDDDTDPVGQSQELYRGLSAYGVETELVLSPRKPRLPEEKHLLDRLNRILAWLRQTLEGASPASAK